MKRALLYFAICIFSVIANANPRLDQANQYYQQQQYQKALPLYQSLAELGSKIAQTRLAKLYMLGQGVDKDYRQAAKWLEKANAQQAPEAAFLYAKLLLNGKGVKQSVPQAVKWFKQSANAGFADAQHALSVLYVRGIGVPQDYALAAKWSEKAAQAGNAEAAYNLAKQYEAGAGVTRSESRAKYWYTQSANKGFTLSQFELGKRYLKNDTTTDGRIAEPDYAAAKKWLIQAADKQHAPAQFALARLYKDPRANMADYAAAKARYEQVMQEVYGKKNQMQYESAFFLGGMYRYGVGTEKDLVKAYVYFQLAKETVAEAATIAGPAKIGRNNIGAVEDNIKLIEKALSSAELVQAKTALADWRKQHQRQR